MAQFVVNAKRFDPYKSFMFRVKWDGKYVAGLSKMGSLKRTTTPVVHREGGDPSHERKSPGKTAYDSVTLERGVTHDPEFEQWANLVHSLEEPDLPHELPEGHLGRRLQRGRPEGPLVQALPLLGVGVPGAAAAGRGQRGGCDRDDQARARGLGARRGSSSGNPPRPRPHERGPLLERDCGGRDATLDQVIGVLAAIGDSQPERACAGRRRPAAARAAPELIERDVELAVRARRAAR